MSESRHILDRAEANQLDRPDRPRTPDGKFASTPSEPEHGRAAEIHRAGFRTLDEHREQSGEEKTYNSNCQASLAEAFDDMKARRRGDDGGLEIVGDRIVTGAEAEERRRDRFIKSHSDHLPKPEELPADVALSKREAAERYSQVKQAQRAEAEAQATIAEASQIAADLGEPLWQEQGEQQPPVAEQPQPQPEPQPGDLNARTLELLQDPAVRAELDAGLQRVTQAEQQYLAGLQQVGQTVVHQALSAYPELTNLTAEQLPVALELMARQDPQRYVQVKATVDRVQAIGHEIQKTQHLQRARAQQEFATYAKVQDAHYEYLTRDEAPETKRQVQQEFVRAAAEDYGIDAQTLAHLYHSQPIMRSAPFQKLMHDAMKWRLAQRARAAITAKPLPSVPTQRPGVQASRPSSSATEYQNLDRKLDKLQGRDQIRAAAKMLSMRRRGGR
jgi:hypothetical protein